MQIYFFLFKSTIVLIILNSNSTSLSLKNNHFSKDKYKALHFLVSF